MSSSTPSVDFSRRSRLRTSLASCLALRCSSFARLVERNRAIDVLLRCPPGRDASYSKKTRRGLTAGAVLAGNLPGEFRRVHAVDGAGAPGVAGRMQPLAGRVAIVTGAGRGLGRAHARALAAAGARVVVNDVGCGLDGRGVAAGVAAAVVEEIRAAGGEATPSLEPVGTVAAGEAIVRTALEAFGRLDVLVNNAGITASHPIEAFPEDAWARIVAVHLTGTFACARAAFATMRTAGRRGRILNTTSGAGLDHLPRHCGLRGGEGWRGESHPRHRRRGRSARHHLQRHRSARPDPHEHGLSRSRGRGADGPRSGGARAARRVPRLGSQRGGERRRLHLPPGTDWHRPPRCQGGDRSARRGVDARRAARAAADAPRARGLTDLRGRQLDPSPRPVFLGRRCRPLDSPWCPFSSSWLSRGRSTLPLTPVAPVPPRWATPRRSPPCAARSRASVHAPASTGRARRRGTAGSSSVQMPSSTTPRTERRSWA